VEKNTQKEKFLQGEGDAWFDRNHSAISQRSYGPDDLVIKAITDCINYYPPSQKKQSLLEVGCGDGSRLAYLTRELGLECFGIDPSAKAVDAANNRGVIAVQGTADHLPFGDGAFDILVFGFCLYLCDRDDLFSIAREANRVVKPKGCLIIHDFYSPESVKRNYHHLPGVFSFKMDYRKLFDWHQSYTCISHHVTAHGLNNYTDDPNEWVATSIIRKNAFD
jgi:ubiquinone/menaquinone biosynthesis C-methylase UbiE